MTLSILHAFQSAKGDGVDTTLVQPSNWNDEHEMTADPFTVIGRGSGSGQVDDISMDLVGVPIGAALPWFTNSPPSNYLMLAGQTVSRTTYAELFSILGTTFNTGGEAGTDFRLPDFRGRTLYGRDNMGGTPANRITNTYFGVAATTVGAVGGTQVGQLPQHTHGVTDPGHGHSVPAGPLGGISGGGPAWVTGGGPTATSNNNTGISINNAGVANATNLPPGIVVNWIVKALYL